MANSGSLHGRTGAIFVALVLCALPASSRAQGPYAGLVGIVRDSSGHPLRDVQIRLGGPLGARAVTGDSGGFSFASLTPGATMVMLRRLGFAPDSTQIMLRAGRVDSLVLVMTSMAAAFFTNMAIACSPASGSGGRADSASSSRATRSRTATLATSSISRA